MTRILITGGAGFVGYHLANKEADLGNQVTILDNFERPNLDAEFRDLISRDNVIFLEKDVSKEETFKQLKVDHYDIVYHLAALNGTANFYKYPAKVLKIGCLSTIFLLDWLSLHQNTPRVIYTSSSETYAGTANLMKENFPIPTPEDIPLAIDDVTNVRWSYGASKLIGEVAFFCYSKMYNFDNFNIVRLHNIYGPRMGNEHVVSQFIIRFLKEEFPFKILGSDQTRSFCFIDDVLEALEKTVNSGIKKEIIHIGNDKEEIKIVDLAKIIFDIEEKSYDFDLHGAPPGSVSRRCPQIEKLKSLGMKDQTPLREGIEQTLRWYRENYFKNIEE
jgi:nucleoside-diphosphate-sugar epimerase